MKWKNQMVHHFQVHRYLWQPIVLLFRIIDSHAKLLVEAEKKQMYYNEQLLFIVGPVFTKIFVYKYIS